MRQRIDSHHHLWDLAVRAQDWIVGPEMAPLNRSFSVADLAPEAAAVAVTGTVVVQSVHAAAETEELLELAAAPGPIEAVVGWADLTDDRIDERLAALTSSATGWALRGIRHVAQDEPDPTWLTRPDVVRGLAAVHGAGLVYEILVRDAQWPAVLDLLSAAPTDQRFVLDHCGKPPVAEGIREPWATWIRAVARHENVVCKLSGLLTEADWARWSPADLRPYVEIVVEAFGPPRVMLGSDWPVCTLAGSYAASITAYDDVVLALSEAEQVDVLAQTACRTYHLETDD